MRVAIVGAGSSGLAALRVLHGRGIPVDCYEKGSRVGGTWRYENDSGTSAAYASLRTNVSRPRMQYPSFPMPASYGDYVRHEDMAEYLDAYTDAFGLRGHIRFSTTVASVTPEQDGRWDVRLQDGTGTRYDVVVVANGHDWDPSWPDLPGATTARITHARDYRTPDRFCGKHVVVIGAGQSAVEIAAEVARVAASTTLSCREAHYIVPRRFLGRPSDHFDTAPANRLPWPIVRRLSALMLRLAHGRADRWGLPPPRHRLLERHPPALSDEILPALRSGAVVARPPVVALDGNRVRFGDGSVGTADEIVCATGYRLSFPFFSRDLVCPDGRRLGLYRRIIAPAHPTLAFIGLVDPFGGLLPVVEAQSDWLADLLDGTIRLPDAAAMEAAIARAEPRTLRRLRGTPADAILCDRHAYVRLLRRDRRRARSLRRRWAAPVGRGHVRRACRAGRRHPQDWGVDARLHARPEPPETSIP
jgi:dimethylaniline monooxygenase (N-oxide forming)